ncbi:hypothetical protein A2U01_0077380, partial [Trifolium medium]|nr:hypothetical protein [Trifolium medium]
MAKDKFEAKPQFMGIVARRDVFCCSRQFSPEILKLSDLASPGARQAK